MISKTVVSHPNHCNETVDLMLNAGRLVFRVQWLAYVKCIGLGLERR